MYTKKEKELSFDNSILFYTRDSVLFITVILY